MSGGQKAASVVSSYIHSTIFEMGGVSFFVRHLMNQASRMSSFLEA